MKLVLLSIFLTAIACQERPKVILPEPPKPDSGKTVEVCWDGYIQYAKLIKLKIDAKGRPFTCWGK